MKSYSTNVSHPRASLNLEGFDLKRYVVGLVLCSSVLLSNALAQNVRLTGNLGHEYQRMNNCGPVTAKMALSLLGFRVTQPQAAAALKENTLDRNVSVNEVALYLERFGLKTVHRWAGSPALVRKLLAAGVPVMLRQQMKSSDDIGHYRVAFAADSSGITFGDSYLGPNVRLIDRTLKYLWKPYGGEFLVVYRPNQEAAVRKAMGQDWNFYQNQARLERISRAQIAGNPNDALAWWSLGRSRLLRGSSKTAAAAFLKADQLGLPSKHYWYQQEALSAWNRVGWYKLANRVAARNLRTYPNSVELLAANRVARAGL
jgi:hypothetical protein